MKPSPLDYFLNNNLVYNNLSFRIERGEGYVLKIDNKITIELDQDDKNYLIDNSDFMAEACADIWENLIEAYK